MELTIHLSSDLHLEFERTLLPGFPAQADVIVLAGDINVGEQSYHVVAQVAEQHPRAQVLFVPGNHEYYHTPHWPALYADYQARIARIPNAHFLDKAVVEIDDVRFIGTTLWTGFDALPTTSVHDAIAMTTQYVADFIYIYNDGLPITPEAMVALYQQNRAWLDQALHEASGKKCVVVTHFPPCLETEHQTIPRSPVTAYFQANCGELIRKHQPDLWLFGHNHWNTNITLGDTRLVSNHGGYPDEVADYNPSLLITV